MREYVHYLKSRALMYKRITVASLALLFIVTPHLASADVFTEFGSFVRSIFSQMSGRAQVSAAAQAAAQNLVSADSAGAVIPGKYIVILKDRPTMVGVSDPESLTQTAQAFINAQVALRKTYKVDKTYSKVFDGFSAELTESQVADLRSNPAVEYVVPDRTITVLQAPEAVVQTPSTGFQRIDANAFPQGKGAGVHVAVIDTGIDSKHPDLAGRVVGGKNCVNPDSTIYEDDHGHGTHVAGTIAANDNDFGVVGVAPEASLWSVKVLSSSGGGSWSQVICGIDFVTSKAPANGGPIKVANMSLGGMHSYGTIDSKCGTVNNDPLHQAICRARDAGVVMVVAAGNSARNSAEFVPAAYDDAVITVSALSDTDGAPGMLSGPADDRFAYFSNWGTIVDIGAPGVNILSTVPTSFSSRYGSGYGTLSGTSMAAPHVAGAAALIVAKKPTYTWKQVRSALLAKGELFGPSHASTDTENRTTHYEPVLIVGTQAPQPLAPVISVTVPNGGEKWEPQTLNTIQWSPYGYNPNVNPVDDMSVFLEKKVGSQFVTVGRVEADGGKASIHWMGSIRENGTGNWTYPTPGEYYIRVVNDVTGSSDRSDAPFTILALPVDLKVNASNGPINISDNQRIVLTWVSRGMDNCQIFNVRTAFNGPDIAIRNLPASGKLEAYSRLYDGYSGVASIFCQASEGSRYGYDNVTLYRAWVTPQLNLSSNNTGENITIGKPVQITWSQAGISDVAIALYKDDKFFKWISKSVGGSRERAGTYSWTPNAATVGQNATTTGAVYKLYITGQKADGTGYLDDRSDAPFRFFPAPAEELIGDYVAYVDSKVFEQVEAITRQAAVTACEKVIAAKPENLVRCTWKGQSILNNTPVTRSSTLSVNRIGEVTSTLLVPGTGTLDLGSFSFSNVGNASARVTEITLERLGINAIDTVSILDKANTVVLKPTAIPSSGVLRATISVAIGASTIQNLKIVGQVKSTIASTTDATFSMVIRGVRATSTSGSVVVKGDFPFAGNQYFTSNGFTISNAPEVPAQNISRGTSRILGGFAMKVVGTPIVDVWKHTFRITASPVYTQSGSLTQITLVDSRGSVVAGPVDPVIASDGAMLVTFTDNIRYHAGRTVLQLKGTVPASAPNGQRLQVVTKPSEWEGIGAVDPVTNTWYRISLAHLTSPVSAHVMTVRVATTTTALGSITASLDASSPTFKNVTAREEGVIVGAYRFTARGEDVSISDIGLKLTKGSAQSVVQVYLWQGDQLLGTAIFPGTTRATSTLSKPLRIPKDGHGVVTVRADFAAQGVAQAGVPGDLVAIDFAGARATGVESGGTVRATGSTAVDGVRVLRSIPEVRKQSLPTASLRSGSNSLLRFSILASALGDVSVGKLTLNLSTSSRSAGGSLALRNMRVHAYSDAAYSQPISGFTSGQIATTIKSPRDGANNVAISGTQGVVIPAGSIYYFMVTADVTMSTSTAPTDAFIVTRLLHDEAYHKLATPLGTLASLSTSRFVWSPNSTQSAPAVTDSDWTNGYKVSGLENVSDYIYMGVEPGALGMLDDPAEPVEETRTSQIANAFSAVASALGAIFSFFAR